MTFYKPTLLCIPKVEKTISPDEIFKTLVALNIGYVYKIIEEPLANKDNYKSFFIKFSWNTKNKDALFLKNKLYEKGSLKLVYDEPWYWKVVESRKIDLLFK